MFYIQINASGKYLANDLKSEVTEIDFAVEFETKGDAAETFYSSKCKAQFCSIVEYE